MLFVILLYAHAFASGSKGNKLVDISTAKRAKQERSFRLKMRSNQVLLSDSFESDAQRIYNSSLIRI